ncbi:MAG TPA: S26 family signal peptidase [Steroidobacteraceae bacterium]|jgi:hypothetical protein|nr:S26 family signal peptidase [Steroidobacteraceae bacterium]
MTAATIGRALIRYGREYRGVMIFLLLMGGFRSAWDSPSDGKTLVKRVIAVPGDTVALEGERLIVNGNPARYAAGDRSKLTDLLRSTRSQNPAIVRERGSSPEHERAYVPRLDRILRSLYAE